MEGEAFRAFVLRALPQPSISQVSSTTQAIDGNSFSFNNSVAVDDQTHHATCCNFCQLDSYPGGKVNSFPLLSQDFLSNFLVSPTTIARIAQRSSPRRLVPSSGSPRLDNLKNTSSLSLNV